MVEPDVVETRLRANLPDVVHLEIEDLTGTRDHYRATVVCGGFAGKSRVEQHQMVYRALGELMSGPVHALALQTYAPDAWNAKTRG
jgi:stress-induced morphogen